MKLRFYWQELNQIPELRNYYLIHFLVIFGLNLNVSIFFLYPLSLGLNFLEMTFVYFSLTRIVYLLFLVPTGILADKYSAKFSLGLGFFAYALGYLLRGSLPFLILPFIGFVISETLIGLADASLIGASDKYLYSFRKRIADTRIFALDHTIIFLTRAISCLTGALIVYFASMRWTQLLGGIIIFCGFVLFLAYVQEPKYRKQDYSISQIYKQGFSLAWQKKKIFYLIAGVSLLGLGVFASKNVFQPLLSKLGLNIESFAIAFGLIFSLQMIFSALGSFLVGRIKKRIKLALMIFATLCLMSLFLFSITLTTSLVLIIFLIWLMALTEGAYFTQARIYLNRLIKKEKIRATVGSVSSLVAALFLALFIPLIGYLTDKLGFGINLQISASLVFLGALLIYFPYLRTKTKSLFFK